MQRRRFVQSIPFLTVTPTLFAQVLSTVAPDSVGQPTSRFFPSSQFAALRRLSDIILPSISGNPGALEAGAPEVLDFLVGQSPLPVKSLYRSGLLAMNTRAGSRFGKLFADLDATQADAVLAPLRQAWNYKDPIDPFALFLRHAKADVLTATTNSREWITAAQRGRGGSGGNGTYWLPVE